MRHPLYTSVFYSFSLFALLFIPFKSFAQELQIDWEERATGNDWIQYGKSSEAYVFRTYNDVRFSSSPLQNMENGNFALKFKGFDNNLCKNGEGEFELKLNKNREELYSRKFRFVQGKGMFYIGKLQLMDDGTTIVYFFPYKYGKQAELRVKIVNPRGDDEDFSFVLDKKERIANVYVNKIGELRTITLCYLIKGNGGWNEKISIHQFDNSFRQISTAFFNVQNIFKNCAPQISKYPNIYDYYSNATALFPSANVVQYEKSMHLEDGSRIDIYEKYSVRAYPLESGEMGTASLGFYVVKINPSAEIEWTQFFPQFTSLRGSNSAFGTFAYVDSDDDLHILFNDQFKHYNHIGKFIGAEDYMEKNQKFMHAEEILSPTHVEISSEGNVLIWELLRTDSKSEYFIPDAMQVSYSSKSVRVVRMNENGSSSGVVKF